MDCGEVFVPFDTTGTVLHLRVPMDWEIHGYTDQVTNGMTQTITYSQSVRLKERWRCIPSSP